MAWTRDGTLSQITWGSGSWNTTPLWPVVAPLSAETRLNHIFPQVDTESHVPFIWHIQSVGAFFVATGSRVYIRSGVTEPMP